MIDIIPNWHPIFVHFTVALLATSAALFLLGTFLSGKGVAEVFIKTAHINLWIGSVITIGTILAGFDAYNTVDHDTPSHLAMTDHRNWALATGALFALITLWSAAIYRRCAKVKAPFLLLLLIATGVLTATAFKGGELVYRHGLGVMSLPNSSGEGHSGHAHPDGGHGNEEKKHEDGHGGHDHAH